MKDARRRVLMLQRLVSLRTLSADAISEQEPMHPHQGLHLANRLAADGFDVVFTNQLLWKLPVPERLRANPQMELLNARAQLGEFDAVLTYAEGGLKFIAGSAWRRRPSLVPVLLTNPRPRFSAAGRVASALMYGAAVRRADAVICCLRGIEDYCRNRRGAANGVFYAPTTVDTDFYDPARVNADDAPAGLSNEPFILAVGDSSRDDRLLYDAMSGTDARFVRVTRDPRVTARVTALADRRRGDVVLENVPFKQLRWLYTNAAGCIVTSALDSWQAAGSTAFTEAASCGTPCVIQAGGCLEAEFGTMLRARGCHDAVRFVSPTVRGIREGVSGVLALAAAERAAIRAQLRGFAASELPIGRAHDAFARALAAAVS